MVIRRFEYDTLRIGEEGFNKAHFERLAAFNDLHGNGFFIVGNRRILFQNYVGVIQVGALTIEILPKLDRVNPNQSAMQKLLIRMLHKVDALPLEKVESAYLHTTSGSLFELYLRIFLSEVRGIIYRGIPKRYTLRQGNERFLRGRFLVPEQLKHNLIHQEHFFVEYQDFSIEHIFNQILKKALLLIAGLPNGVAQDAKSLLPFFDRVSDREIFRKDFAHLKYSRNTECYRSAAAIAELIISNYQPDLQHGSLNIAALLFDMNLLFERYVAKELARCADCEHQISVKAQERKKFWYSEEGNAKPIRPDLLVTIGDKKFVLDTKWKIADFAHPDDGDLKQLYAYSLQFNARQVVLVYPSETDSFECVSSCFSAAELHETRPIAQWKIPLLEKGNLNPLLGEQLLQQLNDID